MRRSNLLPLLAVVCVLSGCGSRPEPQTPTVDTALDVIETAIERDPPSPGGLRRTGPEGRPAGQEGEKHWIDRINLDDFLSNKWLIAAVFLLLQWLEIWYYNRTGKTSKTIDATEAALNTKLGILQKIAYRIWRSFYFKKHPNKNDPDKKPDEENNKETEK